MGLDFKRIRIKHFDVGLVWFWGYKRPTAITGDSHVQ